MGINLFAAGASINRIIVRILHFGFGSPKSMKCRYYNIGIDYCVRDICEMASKVFLNVEMTFSDFFLF